MTDHYSDTSSTASKSISSKHPIQLHDDDDVRQDDPIDLEKQHTIYESNNDNELRSTTSRRINRIESLTRRSTQRGNFSHPLSHVKTTTNVLVDFEGPDDPYRPMNWPFRKKAITTLLYGFTTMGSTFASSVYSSAVPTISKDYHVGSEVSILGLSLFLAGFGLGPLLWAPLSEIYGRKWAVLIPSFIGGIFAFGTATGKDIQTIIITRFFAGLFGAAPVTNTGGVLSDIWAPNQRGTAIVCYAFAVVGGPVFGPIIGGAFIVSDVTWRWTMYLTGMMILFIFTIDMIVLDESYPPVLLVFKARRLRISTGNWALHARHEEWDVSVKEMAVKFGVRPFQMLMTPICLLIALYASFVYGILYGNLAAFPIEFQEVRGWNAFVGSLPFLGLLVGIILGGIANIFNQSFYTKRFKANNNQAVPEARLPPMMIGSVVFTAGLFILGWTDKKSIPWIVPIIGTAFIGFGFFTIFQSALNYLIDTFQRYSASAVAANTFLRSIMALSFPLFVDPMYHKLGVGWATSVFAFFSVLLIPIPYLFYVYGPMLRKRGKYSANMG